MGLQQRDDLGESLVTELLQVTQHSGLEEDLRVAQTVLVLVELQSQQNLLSGSLGLHETLGDSVGSQDGVSAIGGSAIIIYLFLMVHATDFRCW